MNKLFIFYCVSIFLFSIFSYLFIDPNFIYLRSFYTGIAFANRIFVTALFTVFITVFFVYYFLIIKEISQRKRTGNLKRLVLIFVLLSLFSYPAMLSFDIFNYIATSKLLYFYHENPYLIMPMEFTGDPLLLFMHAANKIALYGPSWILLAVIPYILGFGNFLITILNFKLLVSAFYIGSVYLLSKMSKNISGVYFFAFNPLVIIETLISGHNDIVMVFFALLAFFLVSKKRTGLAVLSLLCSIFIKYATIFLVPIFLYTLLQKIRGGEINTEKIYYYCTLLIFLAFLLSPLREELYPWYAIWFLPFVSLIPNKKGILYLSFALSFGLLLRYVPFMLLGTYFGYTPFIKKLVTFSPIVFVVLYMLLRSRIWLKSFFPS